MRKSVIRQLLALRSAAVTVVEQADAILSAIDEEADAAPVVAGCQHPNDKIIDTTTGGGSKPSFFCGACKRTSAEIAADEGKA